MVIRVDSLWPMSLSQTAQTRPWTLPLSSFFTNNLNISSLYSFLISLRLTLHISPRDSLFNSPVDTLQKLGPPQLLFETSVAPTVPGVQSIWESFLWKGQS